MDIIETTLDDLSKEVGLESAPLQSPRGRDVKPFTAEIVRDLELEDLDTPSDPSQSVPTATKSIRDRHHELARLLARGDMTNTQVAKQTGYSASRISVLLGDPAFAELVEHYKNEVEEIFRGAYERLSDLSKEAADILLERLDNNPDAFTQAQLMELLKISSDRTGHGVTSTQRVEGTVTLATPDKIEEIKQRVKDRQHGKTHRLEQEQVIEAEIVED